MKLLKAILFIFILFPFFFISCNSDSTFKVTDEVQAAFDEKYSDRQVTSLEWSMIDGFIVGEFRSDGHYCKGWFTADAKWVMTETSDLAFDRASDLPKLIQEAFNKTSYNSRQIDDIYKIEFPDIKTRYIIQVIPASSSSVFLFYRESGELFKEKTGHWENRPIIIPTEINQYIAQHHGGAPIIDADMHLTLAKVEIFENYAKILCFASTQWMATYWEIGRNDISTAARRTLDSLLEPNDTVDSAYQMQHSEYEEFVFVIVINKGAKTLFIKEDGTEVNITDIPF